MPFALLLLFALKAKADMDKAPVNKISIIIHNCTGIKIPEFIKVSINNNAPADFKFITINNNNAYYTNVLPTPPSYEEIKTIKVTDCGKLSIDNSSMEPHYLPATKEAVYEFSFLYELKIYCDISKDFTVVNIKDKKYPLKQGVKITCDTVKKYYIFTIETTFGTKKDGYPFKDEYKVYKHIDDNKYVLTLDEKDVRKIVINTIREKEGIENVDVSAKQLHKISYHLELSEK